MPNKKYDESGETAKVTFTLPDAVEAETVSLCGDFDGWDASANPMGRAPDGSFSVVVELDAGKSYASRFLLDGDRWENDCEAERYEPNGFGGGSGSI